MNILADAALPGLESAFPKPFNLSLFNKAEEIPNLLPEKQILLCRSTLKVNSTLIQDFPLKIVATATSGSDHLDKNYLCSNGVIVLDAKGCNAISVADYVVACLAYLKKHQNASIKTAGIVGMGYVGMQVYRRLKALDFTVVCYDPLKNDSHFQSDTKERLYQCDLLCLHAEWHNKTPFSSAGLINAAFLSQLKNNCIIINAARGGIVDEQALLNSSNSIKYCTDVFLQEPHINPEIVEHALLCTPHIAGHSLEAKFAAVAIISEKIHRLLNLPRPVYSKPTPPSSKFWDNQGPWEEQILSLYNPINETMTLKAAAGNALAFLALRKAHQQRHDFFTYYADAAQIKLI